MSDRVFNEEFGNIYNVGDEERALCRTLQLAAVGSDWPSVP